MREKEERGRKGRTSENVSASSQKVILGVYELHCAVSDSSDQEVRGVAMMESRED